MKIKSAIKLMCFLLALLETPFAMRTEVDLNLNTNDQLASEKVEYKEHMKKAGLLLNSKKMDPPFAAALKEVMNHRIMPLKTFAKLESYLSSQTPARELEEKIKKFSREMASQAQLFYDITASAHRDDVEGFNQLCSAMLSQMESMESQARHLMDVGVFQNPSRTLPLENQKKDEAKNQIQGENPSPQKPGPMAQTSPTYQWKYTEGYHPKN